MNNILSYIRKNRFYFLVVLVLFLSYSLSHLTNSIILILLPQSDNYNLEILTDNQKSKKMNKNEEFLSVDNYIAMVSGNFIRGKSKNSKQTKEPASTPILQEKEEIVIDPEIQAKLKEENRKVESMMLSGILYSSYSPFSRATFASSGKPSIEFKTRQKMKGIYFLNSIKQNYVVIRTDEFSFRVKIRESIASAKEKEQKRREEKKAAQALKEEKQTESLVVSKKYTKVLSRVDIIRETKDITKIYQGAQFGPYFKNSILEGYKIYSIRKDHIFYSLGARQGDIIKRINGISVDNVNKMMDIWNSLKDYDQITVDLDRKGKIVSFEFVIEN